MIQNKGRDALIFLQFSMSDDEKNKSRRMYINAGVSQRD